MPWPLAGLLREILARLRGSRAETPRAGCLRAIPERPTAMPRYPCFHRRCRSVNDSNCLTQHSPAAEKRSNEAGGLHTCCSFREASQPFCAARAASCRRARRPHRAPRRRYDALRSNTPVGSGHANAKLLAWACWQGDDPRKLVVCLAEVREDLHRARIYVDHSSLARK